MELYIFDLDGTLARIDHRLHWIKGPGPKSWDEFFAACKYDLPSRPVITTLRRLRRAGEAEVWVWSGRSDAVRQETERWLDQLVAVGLEVRMRPAGDYTPDDELKKRWYVDLPPEDRQRLVAVFDDRDRLVRMWRSLGVACFQVGPGDF